jgi:hypothetical protein
MSSSVASELSFSFQDSENKENNSNSFSSKSYSIHSKPFNNEEKEEEVLNEEVK